MRPPAQPLSGLPECFYEHRPKLSDARRRLLADTQSQVVGRLVAEGKWLELILLSCFDPESKARIEDPLLESFWQAQVETLLGSSEGVAEGSAFALLAGKFCFYLGATEPWKYSLTLQEAEQKKIQVNLDWLELGATQFRNYLCCDRYCHFYFNALKSKQLSYDELFRISAKCLRLALVSSQTHGLLGHGLLAISCYLIAYAYRDLNLEDPFKKLRATARSEATAILEQLRGAQQNFNPGDLEEYDFANGKRSILPACSRFIGEDGHETSPEETARIIAGKRLAAR